MTGSIGQGFVVLLGVTHSDTNKEAEWLARKIAGLRVFDDTDGKMNLSIDEAGGGILLVSQFTLYADARKGRRPSFTDAALPDQAEPLVEYMAMKLREAGLQVETGVFGAMMSVDLTNDGPITILLER